MTLAVLLACAYLLGAIPFGFLIARAKGVDIRTVGSGNVGATNVLRALGKGPAIVVFVLDVLKGLIPAYVGHRLLGQTEWAFAAGASAVIGHSLSPFLGFKGGKGIATGLGALIGSTPLVAGGAAAIFLLMMSATMIVSISSVMGALSILPLGVLFRDPPSLYPAYLFFGLYLAYRHRSNFERIRQGIEPLLGQKSREDPPPSRKARVIALTLGVALAATVVARFVQGPDV